MAHPVTDDVNAESYSSRVAAQAASIRPLRSVLTVLAVPFYVVGLLLVAVLWAAGAVKLGVLDARARLSPPPAALPAAGEGSD